MRDLGGPKLDFINLGCVLGRPLESLSRRFGDNCVMLDVKIHVGIRKSFSGNFNTKYCLCREAGCFENVINTKVFNRFLVYREIEFEVSWDSLLVSFWGVFGALGVTLGSLRGYRNIVKNSLNFEDSREPQDLR